MYLPVVLVTGVVPHAFTSLKVEVIYLAVWGLTRLPRFGQRRFQPIACNPEEVLFCLNVHAKPFCILKDLSLGRLVILAKLLLQDDALCGTCVLSSSGLRSSRGFDNEVNGPKQP